MIATPIRIARDEQGAVVVTTAIVLPVLVLMMVFVVDVANWFEHRRHLQLQADAAVLAAAGDVRFPCSDQPILDRASEYGGNPRNAQVGGGQARVSMAINSATYPGQAAPLDSSVRTGGPCATAMIDVKLTEADLPWFFGLADVDHINAHARVEVNQASGLKGLLPISVLETAPKKVKVTFVNEANGDSLGSVELSKNGTTPSGDAIWDNSGAPLSVPFDAGVEHVGMRVALSGTTSTACGDPQVVCYDAGSANGVLHLQGYKDWPAGDGTQPKSPKAESVTLYPGSCNDGYFSSSSSTCTYGVRAEVDFGTATPSTVGAKLEAVVDGDKHTLTHAGSGVWETGAVISAAPGSGAHNVTLNWEETSGKVGSDDCKSGNKNPCKGSFGVVQRHFAADDSRSGPIRLAQVSRDGTFGANSLKACAGCAYDLVAHIAVQGSLENAQSVSDPVYRMRVLEGSQNQTVRCSLDPAHDSLKEALAQGCSDEFTINTGQPCPGQNAQDLFSSPKPWTCVATKTGGTVGHINDGLNERIHGGDTCTSPNNWSSFPNLPAGDPRIVYLFIFPFGSFSEQGNEQFPITNFAAFYITGYRGSGPSPCAGQGDDPAEKGEIVGHFIKYAVPPSQGTGTVPCNPTALGPCVSQLTR